MLDEWIRVFGDHPTALVVGLSLHLHLGVLWARVRKHERRLELLEAVDARVPARS